MIPVSPIKAHIQEKHFTYHGPRISSNIQ